jgi:GNAT superfamily N-acetyltransferase
MPNFQWVVRPLTKVDTPSIAALYDRAMAADVGIGPVSPADWDRFVAMPQNLAGRDFRVALAEERLIGLAESSPRDRAGGKVRFFKIVVDPASRRSGLGVALFRELLTLDDDPRTDFHTLVRSGVDGRLGVPRGVRLRGDGRRNRHEARRAARECPSK